MIPNWFGHRLVQRSMRRDKGSIILEGVVSMAIVSVLTLGYTSISHHASLSQRSAISETIAVQAAQAALEQARATNWAEVGTDVTSPVGLPPGVTKITGGALPAKPAPAVIRGVPITVRTAVGWHKKPSGPSDYGVKIIIVEASWEGEAGDSSTVRTKTEQILLTPGIGEAVPSGIRSASETAPK